MSIQMDRIVQTNEYAISMHAYTCALLLQRTIHAIAATMNG